MNSVIAKCHVIGTCYIQIIICPQVVCRKGDHIQYLMKMMIMILTFLLLEGIKSISQSISNGIVILFSVRLIKIVKMI